MGRGVGGRGVHLGLSTLDVTHVRKCTRLSPLYCTASDKKAGYGTGNEAVIPTKGHMTQKCGQHSDCHACTTITHIVVFGE